MANTDVEATRQALQSAQRTPIAELKPDIENPSERLVEAEVTITWPFSIVTKSIAFKLVESDYRLRMNNGQVRVDFRGAAGKAVANAAIAGGDEVQLSLLGAEWTEAALPKRPDTVEWQLEFTHRLRMSFKRAEDGEQVVLDVDGSAQEEEAPSLPIVDAPELLAPTPDAPTPVSVEPTPSPLMATPALPSKRLASSAFEEDEYASPAFLKRSRLSHGGFWEGDLEDFDDRPKQKKKKRRSRFSMVQKWTYSSRTPSPEPEARQDEAAGSEEDSEEEQIPAKPSTPMVDEGVQTRIEDKVSIPDAQEPAEPLAHSPGPPSSPTPAGIPAVPVASAEDHAPALAIAEEPRQTQPQPNLFAPLQPLFGQSPMQTAPQASSFGSNGTVFGASPGFASQAPFGPPTATFGSSSAFGAPSSSANALGATSGERFGVGANAGFESSAGSAFGANAGSGFGRGFGTTSDAAFGGSVSQYPEPPAESQEQPTDEAVPEDEEHKLYQANEFYTAPADRAPQTELQDMSQGDAGDFTHDIANNVPAFAPSQLEQASWGTLTSLPPQSQAPESNTFDNPVEILSSSPPRAPSPAEEHDTREFEDRQPETSEVEQEEGEQTRQQGYMQVEPVTEDAPIDNDESAMQSQVETDGYEDGGDVAGEDYDLRNYDDAQEDDVVESDDSSEQLVDKTDPDQQVVDFEEESDVDEEEELEYAAPVGHGVSGEPGEFDADGELDEEYEYGDEYEEEYDEEDPMDYDEEEMEESPSTRAPAPPSSKEPVFIDLLSDSEDDEAAPLPAPVRQAVPLPTAAIREPEESQSEEEEPAAESEEEMRDAEADPRSEDVGEIDQVDEPGQAAGKDKDYASNIDTPSSKRSSPPPSEDEDLGPANAPFAAPFAAGSHQQDKDADEDESNRRAVEDEQQDTGTEARQDDQPAMEVAEVDMQDRDVEPPQTAPETQQTSGDKDTQSSVTFASQPLNGLDFAASATQQDVSQPADSLDVSQAIVVDRLDIDKAQADVTPAVQRESPKIVEPQAEVTEVIEEVHEQPVTATVNESQPAAVDESPAEAAGAVAQNERDTTSEEIMAGTPKQAQHDSDILPGGGKQQSDDQAPAKIAPETQTLRAEETVEAMQPAEQDAGALVGEPSPTPSETQQADNAMQIVEDANDDDSEAEYSLALEQQIMTESQSARDSQPSQVQIPSVEEAEPHEEPSRRVTRSRATEKPERDILITVQSLRSWDRKSMSSVATDEDPGRAGSAAQESKQASQTTRLTPEPRQESQSQASPQSIRATRRRAPDEDPSLLLAEETPKRKGHRDTSATARETRSSVAASAEPEERPQSQASTQSIRVTRNRAREDDPSLMLAGVKGSQDDQSSNDPSLSFSQATPKPRKIRGEVTPEPELGSDRSLRSRTPEPTTEKATSPSAGKGTTAEDSFAIDEDETTASLKLKLSKELRSHLAGFIPLSTLRNHIGEHKDVMGVVTSTPEPAVKLKAGPRDHLLELLITDAASLSSSAAVSVAHLLRPRKDSLPTVTVGDVILLRHFSVVAMKGRNYGVRSGEGSSWAVWERNDTEGLPQIKGPPVELGEAERRYADGLRQWWELVHGDEKLRSKLERKTQQAIKVGSENRGKQGA